MITLSIAVLTSFFTIFSLLLFLIALVNNNTKINKIRFEKLIEEKIYEVVPTAMVPPPKPPRPPFLQLIQEIEEDLKNLKI